MNFYKLFGAGLLMLCCTLYGFYRAYGLRLRRGFLVDFIDFLTRLETNIRYFSDDIFKLIRLSAPSSLSFVFEDKREPFCDYWKSCIKKIPKSYKLTKDDIQKLYEFGETLGTTDAQGQIEHIRVYKSVFEQSLKNARKDCDSKSRLYKTLGFFAGAVLALMII